MVLEDARQSKEVLKEGELVKITNGMKKLVDRKKEEQKEELLAFRARRFRIP